MRLHLIGIQMPSPKSQIFLEFPEHMQKRFREYRQCSGSVEFICFLALPDQDPLVRCTDPEHRKKTVCEIVLFMILKFTCSSPWTWKEWCGTSCPHLFHSLFEQLTPEPRNTPPEKVFLIIFKYCGQEPLCMVSVEKWVKYNTEENNLNRFVFCRLHRWLWDHIFITGMTNCWQ